MLYWIWSGWTIQGNMRSNLLSSLPFCFDFYTTHDYLAFFLAHRQWFFQLPRKKEFWLKNAMLSSMMMELLQSLRVLRSSVEVSWSSSKFSRYLPLLSKSSCIIGLKFFLLYIWNCLFASIACITTYFY